MEKAAYGMGKMDKFEYLPKVKESLQQAAELIPHLRQFLQEFKLLIVDVVALITLIITAWYLVLGKLVS